MSRIIEICEDLYKVIFIQVVVTQLLVLCFMFYVLFFTFSLLPCKVEILIVCTMHLLV